MQSSDNYGKKYPKLIAKWFSVKFILINMYIYTHTSIHMHMYMYMYITPAYRHMQIWLTCTCMYIYMSLCVKWYHTLSLCSPSILPEVSGWELLSFQLIRWEFGGLKAPIAVASSMIPKQTQALHKTKTMSSKHKMKKIADLNHEN